MKEVAKQYECLHVATHGKVVLVLAPDGKTLSKPFARIQECYESRKFSNHVFSLKRLKKWYKAHKQTNQFTYYQDWLGFNVPGTAVLKFKEVYEGKENDAEKALLSKLDLSKVCDQYVIGVLAGDTNTLIHEVSHALFYLDPEYATKAYMLFSRHDVCGDMSEIFQKTIYDSHVWMDEFQAYLISGIQDLDPRADFSRLDQVAIEVRELFNSHIKNYPELQALC